MPITEAANIGDECAGASALPIAKRHCLPRSHEIEPFKLLTYTLGNEALLLVAATSRLRGINIGRNDKKKKRYALTVEERARIYLSL